MRQNHVAARVFIIFSSETIAENKVEKMKWASRLRDLNLNALTLLPAILHKRL